MKRNLSQDSENISEMDAGGNLSMAMALEVNIVSCYIFAVFKRVHKSLSILGRSSVDFSRRHSIQSLLSF